jgi:hypothetical protein
MAKFDGGNIDVWVYDLVRNVNQRLTSIRPDDSPVWSTTESASHLHPAAPATSTSIQIAASGEAGKNCYRIRRKQIPHQLVAGWPLPAV